MYRNVVVFDFETYWDSKNYTLSKMPAVEYVRDPRFYAQMMGVSVNGAPANVFEHNAIPTALSYLHLDDPTTLLVGHNSSGFDNLILSEVYGVHPAFMTDTMHMMRWTGVSRVIREQLASMTKWFNTGTKRAGTVISDGKRTKEDFTPEEWEDFKRYCAEDVAQTSACFQKMLPYVNKLMLMFSSITCKMATEPAFIIKPEVLYPYIETLKEREAAAFEELKKVFTFREDQDFMKFIRSATKFEALLKMLGCDVPKKLSVKQTETARKKYEREMERCTTQECRDSYERFLADEENYAVYTPALAKNDLEFLELLEHPNPQVRLLAQIRLDHNSSVAMSRAQNLLHMAQSGKPMPVLLKCYYAHTSRYGAGTTEGKSDGIQIQNIPKHRKDMRPLRESIQAPDGYVIVACDSSQIEARVLAYEAQNVELLDHFRHGRDPYAEMAAKFGYNLSADVIHNGAKSGDKLCKMLRQVGKKLVLSCFGAGTQVLTHEGWENIEDICRGSYIWDGRHWVKHDGVVVRCKPREELMIYHGVLVTKDHLIYDVDSDAWYEAQDADEVNPNIPSDTFFLPDDDEEYILPISSGERNYDYVVPANIKDVSIPGEPKWYTECPYKEKVWVYDLVNCGPKHRYVVRTKDGAIVVHNCGYGTSAIKLQDTLWKENVRLDEDRETHNTTAQSFHKIYRDSNIDIVRFWKMCGSVIRDMCEGGEGVFGGPDGKLFAYKQLPIPGSSEPVPSIELPTGYILRYPNLRYEKDSAGKVTYYYDRPLGKNIVKTRVYGAALTENLTQSLAFQILLYQACLIHAQGIPIHCNIHDSFAAIVPEDKAEWTKKVMLDCMKFVPDFVAGLPLDAEAEIGKDFTIV